MMNICESVIKDRKTKQAKVIVTPEPKWQQGTEDILGASLRGQTRPSVDSRHLNQQYFLSGTWKTCISPTSVGKLTARKAEGDAGLGRRKKRMPLVTGWIRVLMSPDCESKPTSDWSFIARESGELFLWGKANDGFKS